MKHHIPKCLKTFFETFKDGEENIKKGRISVYPYNSNSKIPIGFDKNHLPKELLNEDGNMIEDYFTDEDRRKLGEKNKNGEWKKIIPNTYWNELQLGFENFRDNNNISFTIGYDPKESGYSLSQIDVDGFKVYPKDENGKPIRSSKAHYNKEIHKQSCELLYEVLKDLDIESIHQKTWMDGFHLDFITKEHYQTKNQSDDYYFKVLEYIHFPKDFPIKELRDKSINDGTNQMIEVFSHHNQRTLSYPSTIVETKINSQGNKSKNGKYIQERIKGSYEVITKGPSFNKLFDNPVQDLETKFIETFTKHGYRFDEEGFKNHHILKKATSKKASEGNSDIIHEDSIDLDKLGEKGLDLLVGEVSQIIQKTHGNHNEVILSLEGGLEDIGVPYNERRIILEKALNICGDLEAHQSQIESSLNDKRPNKKGFGEKGLGKYPQLKEHIQNIKNIKNRYWKNIDDFKLNILKIAYEDLILLIKQEFPSRKSNEKDEDGNLIFNPVEFLDEVFFTMGVDLFVRLELYMIGTKHLYSNFQEAIDEYMRKPFTKHSKKIKHGFDESYFFKQLVKSGVPLDEHINEFYEKLMFVQTQITILGITNSQAIKNLYEQPKGFKVKDIRKQASEFLRKECGFMKTKKANYIWDDVSNSYEHITIQGLGNQIYKKFGIRGIEKEDLNKIYDSSDGLVEEDDSIYKFNDGFLHVEDDWNFEQTDEFHKYFTIRTSPFNFLDSRILNPQMEQDNLYKTTLEQIFIPKSNQENRKMLDDFFERTGSSFNTRNIYKTLTIYYGKGNNGKEMIITMLKEIFGKRCVEVDIEQVMNDDFRDLDETDVWIFDELDDDDFNGLIAKLKNLTGGKDRGNTKRQMRSQEYNEEKYPSHIFGFTNVIPNIPINQIAFFDRVDVLELPNVFVNNPKASNEYPRDSMLKDKLKKDDSSKQWFISKALNTYSTKLHEKGSKFEYILKQTSDETRVVITKNNPMKRFILGTYKVDKNKISWIPNQTIMEEYKDWCLDHQVQFDSKDSELKKQVGREMVNIFGEEYKQKKSVMGYYVEHLEEDEEITIEQVNDKAIPKTQKKKNLSYVIDEREFIMEEAIQQLKGDSRKIYDFIKNQETKIHGDVPLEMIEEEFIGKCDVKQHLQELVEGDYIILHVG